MFFYGVNEKIKVVEQAKEKGNVTREQVKKLIEANDVYIANENKTENTTNNTTALESQVREKTGYGNYGVREFSNLLENSQDGNFDLLYKNFNTAYEIGLKNPDYNAESITNDIVQRTAFNAGKLDYLDKVKNKQIQAKNNVVWGKESGLTNKQLNNHQAVAEYIEQHIGDVYTIIESGQKVYIGEELPQEYTQSKYTTYLRNVNRTAARGKNKAIDGFGELIETATNRRWEKTKHAQNKDAKYGMYRYDNSFAFPIKDNKGKVTNIRAFDVELLIRNASDGNKYLYDIVGIKENTTTEIGILERMTRLPAERQATRDSVSNEIVSQNSKSVKSDFSLKEKETNVENIPQFSLKASNNGIYDYTKSFAQQVDDWKNGLIPQNDSLLVGATPKVFKKIGFNPLPFTINQRHIDYAINGTKDIDHSLGETLLAQLPQALENPLAIISSQTQSDRVVAILKIQHKGKNIVAPVEIDGYGTQNNVSIDSNAITSVFGKGNAITKLLTDALNSEIKGSISVFYWNKKEALSLLQTPGLQLPSHLPQDGFIHSITEKGSPVKQRLKNITESQQFKRWFGNSKVVNKDGTPKIVYHGTSKGGHTVFDAWGKGKFGLFGIGIYMTESREVAEGYTKKGKGITPQVYELYANITNPLDMDKTANVKKWEKQTSGEIDFSNCITNEDCFRAVKEYCEDEQMVRWEAEEYITEIIRDMGYDGITHIGGGRYNKQDATRHRVWIALDSTQIKSATDNIGTFDNSNPDIRYSLKGTLSDSEIRNAITDKKLHKYVDKGIITTEKYNELVKTYGAIPVGENPHREIQVPQKTAKDKKVSQTVRTILEAKATPDEAVPTIEKMVEDGIFSYDVYTDKQALTDANSNIKKYGWDESVDDWFKDVEKGMVSKQHTAMGWALYNNAANIAVTTISETERTSAIKTSLKILDAMVRHQRSAAQALQATRILKKLSPETQLYAVQKSVQAFQKELSDKYGDKAPNLEIDAELAEQFLNAKTPEERAEIETEIYKDIGRQMPSRFVDKWNAWRYLAMLGNVRTHIRNIGGNAFFAPVVMTKDLTATAIESIVYRVSGKKTVRGKALITGSKADRALLKAAWDDYGTVADLISNGGKYSDFAMANQKIEDGRQVFKFKPLEMARKGNSALLEKEDMWFSKPHYAYALAQYCKANNITAEQIKRGKYGTYTQAEVTAAVNQPEGLSREEQRALWQSVNTTWKGNPL